MSKTPEPQKLWSPKQWRAMCSAVRYELYLLLEQLAPCSVSELAAAGGRGAAGLYRHLEVMADAGILIRAGQRKAGRRWGRIYDLNRESGMPMCDPQTGAGVKDDIKLCSAMMRAAIRDYGRAMHARKGAANLEQPSFITSLFEITRLDEKSAAEMQKLSDRMMEIIVKGRKGGSGRRYRIGYIASPVT
ncbi:MAG: helix-turn-helix domain-containing protein [Planctomycetes bacterium]|nr:helix-turn-helix domain-containing protein [Planctomycetota bacterium]